jgi:hypothetical protein
MWVGRRQAFFGILTEDGEVMECDLITWAQWLDKNRSHRIIAQETLPEGYFLSTVFLGLNQQYDQESSRTKPLWFETMLFSPPTGKKSIITGKKRTLGDESFCQRYTTLTEALAGHENVKKAFLASCDSPQQ